MPNAVGIVPLPAAKVIGRALRISSSSGSRFQIVSGHSELSDVQQPRFGAKFCLRRQFRQMRAKNPCFQAGTRILQSPWALSDLC